MSKQLLMSIQPQHLYNILTGKKTLEIRKQIPKGFKGWVNLYCTKGFPMLSRSITFGSLMKLDKEQYNDLLSMDKESYGYQNHEFDEDNILNGSVVARFWFDEYEEIEYVKSEDDYYMRYDIGIYYERDDDFFKKLQLSRYDLWEYGKGKDLYAMHIKNLEIFDKPKALSEFKVKTTNKICGVSKCVPLMKKVTKAPQSFMYVEVEE